MKVITSLRGKPLIVIDNYSFYMQKALPSGKQRWACSTHSYRGCRANIYTFDSDIISMKNEHDHMPRSDLKHIVSVDINPI